MSTDDGPPPATTQPPVAFDVSKPDPVATVNGYPVAGPAHRFGAYSLDLLVLLTITTLTSLAISLIAQATPFDIRDRLMPWSVIVVVLFTGYPLLFWWRFSATPGKMLAGTRIVDCHGRRVTLSRAVIRWAFYLLSWAFLFVGFIWILADYPRYRGIYDMVAGTFVINERAERIQQVPATDPV